MHGLKSAILAICQKSAVWQCPVSAALKNGSQDFFPFNVYILILIFKKNMKPLSAVPPGLLVIQVQIQAVWCIVFKKYSKELQWFPLSNRTDNIGHQVVTAAHNN